MVDVTALADITVEQGVGGKIINVDFTEADGVDDGDTFTVDLNKYGYSTLRGVQGFIHTTEGSVVAAEAPTTSVTAGVATITVGGAIDDKARSYMIWAK